MRATEIGRKSGLRYIYAGNMPGEVEDFENTRCPNCQQLLIERYGYHGLFPHPRGLFSELRHRHSRALGA
jgi:hypothetical protein